MLLGALAALVCIPRDRGVTTGGTLRQRPGLAAHGTFSRPLVLAYSLTGLIALPHGVMMALWSIYMLDRGASLPLIGLTYTAAALPGLLIAPFAGRRSDRRGRYWPIALSTVAIGAIYVIYGLPLAPVVLLVTCAVEGLITAIGRSALDGFLADATPQGLQGRVQANFAAVTAGGRLVGSAGAGLLYLAGPGIPWAVGGILCALVGLALFLPTVARLFIIEPTGPR